MKQEVNSISSDIYSSEEIPIGKLGDKTLYRKVYTYSGTGKTGISIVIDADFKPSNVDMLVDARGAYCNNSSLAGWWIFGKFWSQTDTVMLKLDSNGLAALNGGSNSTLYKYTVIVEYTKP